MTSTNQADGELRDAIGNIQLYVDQNNEHVRIRDFPDVPDVIMQFIKARDEQREREIRLNELNRAYLAGDNFRLYTEIREDYFTERTATLTQPPKQEEE